MESYLTAEGLKHLQPLIDIAIKLLVAAILGGLVGYDREKRLKSAGLKTNILICMGATIYTAISLQNLYLFPQPNTTGGAIDPNRVIAQIVSGVGFLGAGAIIQSRGSVTGMTTAATIWIMAALGAVIGSGQILPAILFTFFILVVLKLSSPIYALLNFSSISKTYHLQVITIGDAGDLIEKVLMGYQLKKLSNNIVLDRKKMKILFGAEIYATQRDMKRIYDSLAKVAQVDKVSYFPITPGQDTPKEESPQEASNSEDDLW